MKYISIMNAGKVRNTNIKALISQYEIRSTGSNSNTTPAPSTVIVPMIIKHSAFIMKSSMPIIIFSIERNEREQLSVRCADGSISFNGILFVPFPFIFNNTRFQENRWTIFVISFCKIDSLSEKYSQNISFNNLSNIKL